MAEGSIEIVYLGGFGLGVAATLLGVLLGRAWFQRFLATAGPRTRGQALFAVCALAGLSAALLVGRSREPATAALAHEHRVPAERSLVDAVSISAPFLAQRTAPIGAASNPAQGAVEGLLARAGEHRRKREFKQACEVYAVIVGRGAMTADAWADYADALGSLAGSLAGAPGRAIEAALALDPSHAKALWLRASLAHEERRYADALDTWKRLLAIVPPGSPDARIVESNIAEASRLASS